MKKWLLGVVGFLMPLMLLAQGLSWQVGSTLPNIEMKDQFDKSTQVNEEVRLILFARGMDSKEIINEMLSGEEADFLVQHQAVYIADISAMPSLITKLFALPKMQGYNYSMLLDYSGETTKGIPSQEKKVTLVHLDKNKVINIEFVEDASILKAEIQREGLP